MNSLKMKKIAIILLSVFMAAKVYSQDTLYVYYDSDWNKIKTKNKKKASFFRKSFEGENGTYVANDYFISGKKQMEGSYKSKKQQVKIGHFIYYYENGTKLSEGNYEKDNRTGLWTFWYDNGQKKSEGKYISGFRNGTWNSWHESGSKKASGNIVNGLYDGAWTFWYNNGGYSKVSGEFRSDNKIGTWNFWKSDDVLAFSEKYDKDGGAEFIAYYENGNVRISGQSIDEEYNGDFAFWTIDGRIFFAGEYKNGERDGIWTRYFPDGTEISIQYTDGKIADKKFGQLIRRKN